MRKSPIRHKVRSHSRRGLRGTYSVRSYVRGKGERVQPITRKRKLTKERRPKSYTVNFKYSNKAGDGESVIVIATDYKEALAEALEEKKDVRQPIEVEVIDPDFGKVFRAIGRGVRKVGELGVRYSIKGVRKMTPYVKKGMITVGKQTFKVSKRLGKAGALALAEKLHERRVKELLRKAYSRNKVERMMARYRLKQEYPELYNICSFSRR